MKIGNERVDLGGYKYCLVFQRGLFIWEIIQGHQWKQLDEYSSLGCRSSNDTWSYWATLGVHKAYFVKGHGSRNMESISKREVSCLMCSAAILLATAVSTLPSTHPRKLELQQVPLLCKLLPMMLATSYANVVPFSPHAINSPLCSNGEGDYTDHPGFLTGYQVTYNQKKSPPLCRNHWLEHFLCHTTEHPSGCSPLGFTVELFQSHSVWARLTNSSRPSIITNV